MHVTAKADYAVRAVIELASGTIRSTKTSPGDKLEFSPVERQPWF